MTCTPSWTLLLQNLSQPWKRPHMSDCNLCAWLDSLEADDMRIPTEEDRAKFARFLEQEWVVDLHNHSADVTTLEAAADHLKDMGV